MVYLFKYNAKNLFSKEVKNYMKYNGFANYIIKREL